MEEINCIGWMIRDWSWPPKWYQGTHRLSCSHDKHKPQLTLKQTFKMLLVKSTFIPTHTHYI